MKISVFVIIHHAERILLIRESNPKWKNKWFLPGGKWAAGETFIETGIREVKEEAGFDIAINGLLLIRIFSHHPSKKENIRIILSGRITGGEMKSQYDEHSMEAKWFTLEDIPQIEMRESIAEYIINYPVYANLASIHLLQIV